MKVAICGSMSAAKEMLRAKRAFDALGLDTIIQDDVEEHAAGRIADEEKWRKLAIDPLKSYYEEIKRADAVLVVNMEKRGIPNYIGANTLIEMAFAYVLDKRIYLLNPVPDLPYTDEIAAMKPVVIDGDFSKVR
jgi:hypothetical protein